MSSSSSGSSPWDMDSYDGKLMFAAIISLLLVLSFVLLLHAYARWVFLLDQSALHRRRPTLTLSTTATTTTRRLHHHLNVEEDEDEMCGLDESVVASIPTFVHKEEDKERDRLECVICLSVFEDGDIGRHLPNCDHAFHVQCIDKWLRSHSTCPICRALVGCDEMIDVKSTVATGEQDGIPTRRSSFETAVDQEPSLQVVIEVESDSVASRCLHSVPPPPSPPPPLPLPVGHPLKSFFSMRRVERNVFPSSSNVDI